MVDFHPFHEQFHWYESNLQIDHLLINWKVHLDRLCSKLIWSLDLYACRVLASENSIWIIYLLEYASFQISLSCPN